MLIAVVLVIIAIGSVAFHIWSPWWFTPLASNWGSLDDAIVITFWITGVAYVAVILFMAYCCYKYRYDKNRRSEYDPENPKMEWTLSILTTLGVVGLLTPGLIAWNDFVTVPQGVREVEVFGKQWDWSYRLPGKDGKLGKSSIRLINDDNPFGIDPKDPNGKDDVLIEGDDLHLQLDKPVKMLLRSQDVLHDFYVPQFRAKMDLVPGMVTFFWMTPTRAGTFEVLCAELCGVGHHAMRGTVVVDAKAAYDKWLAEQETFASLYPETAKVRQAAMEDSEEDTKGEPILTASESNAAQAVQ